VLQFLGETLWHFIEKCCKRLCWVIQARIAHQVIQNQMDSLGHVFTSCRLISQQSRIIFQVANVWDRAKEFASVQAQGSMCETQVRLTNSSLELKFYLLCTIYKRDMTQKESFESRAIMSHNSRSLASPNKSLIHKSRRITMSHMVHESVWVTQPWVKSDVLGA